jgi:hypothetical protein
LKKKRMLSRFIRGTVAGLTPLLIGVAEELAREGRTDGDVGAHAPEEFRWCGSVEAGRCIVVRGLNGEIRAEAATGGQVEIVASKHGRRDDPRAVEIQLEQDEGGNGNVNVSCLYPHQAMRGERGAAPAAPHGMGWWPQPRRSDVRVDFIVRVPEGVRFIGRTVNGGISAVLDKNDVEVSVVNGNIRFSTGGHACAKTVNGSIKARLDGAAWSRAVELKTKNGNISVELRAELNADFQAATVNGKITHELPLTLKGTPTRRRLAGTIGQGGSELILKATNGNIELRQSTKSDVE